MGQFKPMVKMKTTEPSVILKLKKGGSVANPKKMALGGMTGMVKGMADKITAPKPGSGTGSPRPFGPRGSGPNDAGPMPRPLPKRGSGPNDAPPGAIDRLKHKLNRLSELRGTGPNDAPKGVIDKFKGMVGTGPKKMAMGGTMGTSLPPSKPRVGPGNPGPMPKPRPRPVMPKPKRGSGPNDAGPGRPLVTPPVSRHPDDFGLKAPGMKRGGEMETAKMHAKEKKSISNLDKKLSKHADMPASKGHKGLKTGGVVRGQGGYKTGGVVNGQGGYKTGGMAKKAYATGGEVKSGAPVAMPERKKSAPVAIDRLSGTFKKGGKVRGGMAC
jgi:hypothetical protein